MPALTNQEWQIFRKLESAVRGKGDGKANAGKGEGKAKGRENGREKARHM